MRSHRVHKKINCEPVDDALLFRSYCVLPGFAASCFDLIFVVVVLVSCGGLLDGREPMGGAMKTAKTSRMGPLWEAGRPHGATA